MDEAFYSHFLVFLVLVLAGDNSFSTLWTIYCVRLIYAIIKTTINSVAINTKAQRALPLPMPSNPMRGAPSNKQAPMATKVR